MSAYTPFGYTPFKRQLDLLIQRVTMLSESDPEGYKEHAETKRLKKIVNALNICTQDPTLPEYRCTSTLPKQYSHWYRIKKRMPKRHRLFSLYKSEEMKVVYAWLNGSDNIRKEGDKNDVYNAFIRLLNNRLIPNDFNELLANSKRLS